MTGARRELLLLFIAMLAMMLLFFALHGAVHAHPHHHEDCGVCRVMDGWFSLLRRIFRGASAAAPALGSAAFSIAWGVFPARLPRPVTPVSLKVKITS